MFSEKSSFCSFFKRIAFLFILCGSIKSVAASDCIYVSPLQEISEEFFFHELILRSDHLSETFASILDFFEQNRSSFHQFQFKYPLNNQEHAQTFAKVLQIKAQQAHRFVPTIAHSQFNSACHLGFIRNIKIKEPYLRIQERVLVDRASHAVIFIEEWIETEKGVMLGSFAALNEVIEESGLWYFAGTYLYMNPPAEDEIQDRIEMFDKTYENMLLFIENEDVDEVYNHLSK